MVETSLESDGPYSRRHLRWLYLIKSALHFGSTLYQNLLTVIRVDNSVGWGQGEDLELQSGLTSHPFLSEKEALRLAIISFLGE